MKKITLYLTCLVALYACNAPNDELNSGDVGEAKYEEKNVTPPPISSFGFDQLGCIVTIPDYQFEDAKTGSLFTTRIYVDFETQLIELGQHKFSVSANRVNAQTVKDSKKDFFVFVPSFWECPKTIEEIKKIHAKFYPNTKLDYGIASIADYAESILGKDYPK